MKTERDRALARALGDDTGEEGDENKAVSLRDRALQRAREESVPRTLTPWEWEEWYAQHGHPESHKPSSGPSEGYLTRAWRRFWSWLGPRD